MNVLVPAKVCVYVLEMLHNLCASSQRSSLFSICFYNFDIVIVECVKK